MTFRLVPGRTIQERVFYDANGNGMQDDVQDEPGVLNVCLNARSVDSAFNFGGCTNADGDYAITGVLPAFGGAPLQYQVRANAQGTPYASEYFDRVPNGSGPALGTFLRSQAELVAVNGGDRTGIDFSLGLGGGVQGTVIEGGTGLLLGGIQIYVNPFNGDADGYGGQTDATGRYLITGLPPGSYQIQARDDRNGVYAGEYFDDKIFSNEATPLPVAARASAADTLAATADFALEKGGVIEGLVYEDKDGDGTLTDGGRTPLQPQRLRRAVRLAELVRHRHQHRH